ncbi:MAG: hypothetical protein O2783_05960 [Chloroflexi bacterium]|nr:hypothetical protein [Chloroflexota bacterium]
MTDNSPEVRRQEIAVRLRTARDGYSECVSDVNAAVANNGSEWAIVDLLRHVTGGGYGRMLRRLLEEDGPDLGGAYDPEAAWKRVTDTVLGEIDEAIRVTEELTAEQLGRSGQRGGKPIVVLDVLALIADHYEEHLMQLRNEIRPRESLLLN